MAWLDDLTGLSNRRAFLDKMDQRLHSSKRQLLAIGLMDLDNFKDVNDRLGHATGDALLIEVGKRLSGALGPGDVLARLGGDEFAILLPSCQSEHQLRATAARLLQVLDNPISVDGQILQIGLSLGLVLHDKNDALGPDALLRRADLAMYAAKHNGRRQYRIFDLEMERQIHHREYLLNWVKGALRDKQLELHYQPILTVEPGKAAGDPRIHEVEALLRLRDHEGLHNAGEFEAVLDDAQLAVPIGRYVLDAAVTQLLCWHQAGLQLRVCVNISPQHFLHPQFLGDLRDLLERHPQCAPEWLVLELTEHGSELNSHVARFVVTACRRLGIRVSLDDFGTGSASLTHLQLLEASTVKIDRSFTRQLFDESADLSITYGLLRTAQMMGLSAVAEGVRTARQAQVLVALGCRKLQGYAIAKPMSAKALEAWLQQWQSLLPWTATLAWQKAIGSDAIHAMVEHGRSVARAALGALDDSERQSFSHAEAHRRCALGRWCESQTGQYGHVPGFRKLMEDHDAFHARLRTAAEAPAEDAVVHAHRLKALSQSVREQFWNLLLHPLPRSRVEADDEGQAEALQTPPRLPPELLFARREPDAARSKLKA